MGVKIAAQYIEHFDQERIAHRVENLVSLFAAGDDVPRTKHGKMLRRVRLLQTKTLDDDARATATQFADDGLVERGPLGNGRVVLTVRGRLLADRVTLALAG